ncbi:MAG: hypothetical protein IKW00_09325 [Clostridia bacterium]|nr:hypothetical protein [Clostridia bacterium]
MKKLMILLLALLLFMAQASASYIETVQAGQPIFKGPGYGYARNGAVSEKGRYTIVAEERDEWGNLWGKLKSGAGWIDLSDVRGEVIPLLTAEYTDKASIDREQPDVFLQEDSEYTTWIRFKANQRLENVQLVSFELADAGLKVDRVLHARPVLEAGVPLAAGVVFYGDMTAYGLLCTDFEGKMHCFVLTVSGYDGSLVVNESKLLAF